MPSDYLRVHLICNAHGVKLPLCVPVPRAVPDPLRCSPLPSGGGGGSQLCAECNELLRPGRVEERVIEVVRRGWADHIRAGAVIVNC